MPQVVPLTFSELFARARIASKLTQRQVADQLADRGFDFTSVAVSNWETGKNTPRTSDVVYALEDILDAAGMFTGALGLAPTLEGRTIEQRLADLEQGFAEIQAALQALLDEARSR